MQKNLYLYLQILNNFECLTVCLYINTYNIFLTQLSDQEREDRPPKPADPCRPNPCGANAIPEASSFGICTCTCPPQLFGDPYLGCRPECVLNSDCDRSQACVGNKCQDPCVDTCGINADCQVVNHVPTCTCHKDYVGNAFEECHKKRKHDLVLTFFN